MTCTRSACGYLRSTRRASLPTPSITGGCRTWRHRHTPFAWCRRSIPTPWPRAPTRIPTARFLLTRSRITPTTRTGPPFPASTTFLLALSNRTLVGLGPGAIVTCSLPGVDVQFLHHGLRYRPDLYGAIPPYQEARAIVTCSLPGVDVQFLHHGAGHWPYFVGPGAIVTRSLPGVDVQFLHHGVKVRCCDAAGALSVFGRLN